MKLSFAATSLLFIAGGANAFAPRSNPTTNKLSSNTALFETAAETPVKEESPAAAATSELEEEDTPFFEKMVDGIKFRYGIFQDAQAEGYDMKQSAACALAGTYDEAAIKEEINDIISSNSCVMFSWEASPSCKKAIEAFEKVGAHVKIVRLDDPWEDGNPIRAEIGKMTGKLCKKFCPAFAVHFQLSNAIFVVVLFRQVIGSNDLYGW